jgi:hypothetical protein
MSFVARRFLLSAPETFGYKMGGIVVRSGDVGAVAAAAGVRSQRQAGWRERVEAAYGGKAAFVSPPVGDWVCLIGQWAMGTGELAGLEGVAGVVASLSSQFGEAQGFATHRVVEYHHWIAARGGRETRCFAYLGERGEVLADRGAVTEAEREMRFEELAEFKWVPGEDDVMAVAAGWSFDPTRLGVASGPEAAGILGRVEGLGRNPFRSGRGLRVDESASIRCWLW